MIGWKCDEEVTQDVVCWNGMLIGQGQETMIYSRYIGPFSRVPSYSTCNYRKSGDLGSGYNHTTDGYIIDTQRIVSQKR